MLSAGAGHAIRWKHCSDGSRCRNLSDTGDTLTYRFDSDKHYETSIRAVYRRTAYNGTVYER